MLKAVLLIFATLAVSSSALSEQERLAKYKERGYEWPLPKVVPDTPGWRKLMERRFEQISQTMENTGDRYNAWIAVMASALVQQNFTENG